MLIVVLGKHHWMLYWLVTAMYPQFLITLDEEMEEKAVTVRVGQAVNTVGLAGTRHGISGVSITLLARSSPKPSVQMTLFWIEGIHVWPLFAADSCSSKRTKHPSGSVQGSVPSWAPTSTSHTRPFWRTLLY